MMRGAVVTVAMQGDLGKPRPALVVQTDNFAELGTVTILPITSTLVDAPLIRIRVQPSSENGLLKTSQIMIDKISTTRRDKLGPVFGHVAPDTMTEVERSLAVFLGITR